MEKQPKETKNIDAAFTKGQLIKSKRYAEYGDLLDALLTDTRLYTDQEIKELINAFMKGALKC